LAAKLPIFVSKEIEMQKNRKPYDSLEDFPTSLSDSEVLYWLRTREVDIDFLNRLKDCSATTDDIIAGWLNISVRTLRNYRNPAYRIRENIKEQALLLMALFVHGNDVFGNAAQFNDWLNTENFFFEGRSPSSMLNTVSGIRFVNERLHAIEYGDNV
jgi:uncharacterized protein (DUF2384 family)